MILYILAIFKYTDFYYCNLVQNKNLEASCCIKRIIMYIFNYVNQLKYNFYQINHIYFLLKLLLL